MPLTLQQANTLIVDDFQSMRTMLRDFVKSMGMTRVDTACHGKDAISHLAESRYDIVLCDYNLGPGANGQQVLEEARARNLIGVSTIWVIVTAEKTADMVMGAAEIKPDDYLLKPINQVLLQSRLEKLIARKQALGAVETAIRAKDFGAALAQCDLLLRMQSANTHEVLRIKSDLLQTLGDFDAARAVYESVLAQRSVAWAKTGLGKVLFYTGDCAGAIVLFEQVLTENQMYIEAADWLAKTHEALGDTVRAQQVLQDAVKLSPNSPLRQKKLGDTALKNGELDVAQAAFEKNIKISEFSAHKSPAVYARLAELLVDKGESQEALNVLKRSKTDFRYNSPAALQTAAAESRIYQKLGQTDKAQAALASAEQLATQMGDKLSPELMVELARSQLKLGQKDKACQLLGQVVKNDHENAQLSSEIEAIFDAENLAGEGQALIQASRQEVIDINNQGVMLAKQGQFQQGALLLREAVKKLPSSEVMLVNLCGLLIAQMTKSGYTDTLAFEARELLDRVHTLNPGNKKFYSYSLVLARLQRA
ncbi:response regulator [Rhodoferax sp. 4810]|nr:response regulator [Rhodoferax jenense]